MQRISRAVVALLTLAGLALTAAPLRADEGHCERQTVTVSVPAHAPVVDAPSSSALVPDRGCPACPANSCSAMHGCSVAFQVSPEVVARRALLPLVGRSTIGGIDAVPTSVTHAPPTPPPLVALSPA